MVYGDYNINIDDWIKVKNTQGIDTGWCLIRVIRMYNDDFRGLIMDCEDSSYIGNDYFYGEGDIDYIIND